MTGKGFTTEEKIEAFLDEEMTPTEMSEWQHSLEREPQFATLQERMQCERNVIRGHLRQEVDEASASVDFDAFQAQLFSQIDAVAEKKETTPVSQPKTSSSWWTEIRAFLSAHPSATIAFAATATVLMVFALPLLDPSTPDANACVVDKVVSSQATQYAVLQTKNRATGQPMTVIMISEPGELPETGIKTDVQTAPSKDEDVDETQMGFPTLSTDDKGR